MSKKSAFIFPIIFFCSMFLSCFAQQQGTWSVHASGAALPSVVPRAGYQFFRTSDSTAWQSTGITWQQLTTGSGSGISVATARAKTGWTSDGHIAQDTLANYFLIDHKFAKLAIVDADNDSLIFRPQSLNPFIYKDGATTLFAIDSTNGGVQIGAAVFNSALLSLDLASDQVGLSIQGHSTQTADLVKIENSSGTDLFRMWITGNHSVMNIIPSASGGNSTIAFRAAGDSNGFALIRDVDSNGSNKFGILDAASGAFGLYRVLIEPDGDISFGHKNPVSGSVTTMINNRPAIWTAEGIPAFSDSAFRISITSGQWTLSGLAGDGDATNIAGNNSDQITFNAASGGYIFNDGNIGIGMAPARSGLEQKVALSTDAIIGANSTGIGLWHAPPTIGFNTYINTTHKSIATGFGARIHYDQSAGAGMYFNLSSASAATDADQTYPSNPALTIANDRVGMGTNATLAKAYLEQSGKIGQTAAIFGKDGTGVGITEDDPAVMFNGYDDGTNKKAIAAGFVGYAGIEDGTGILKLASTSSSGSADGNVTLLNRMMFEPDGDGIFSGGTKSPMAGTITVSGKDLVVTREGTPANSDSSASLRVVTGLGDLLLKNGSGNGVEVKIDATANMDLITLSTANVSITAGSFEGNSLIRGSGNFSGTAQTDTVSVTGGTTSDNYQITWTSALEATITGWWVEALTDKFVVHLEGTITTGSDTYNWFRIK
jgi:hypothetical protein